MKSQQRETLEAYLALLHTEEQEQKTAQEKTSKPQLSEQDDAMMKRVMTFVEEHIGDTDAGVSEMAEAALMSKSNLTRKLKELIGLTPGDFLKEARIKKATELLKNTNMNISEIAYRCGFNDPKYFSKVFKSSIGKTPSEYRE
jgi:transcriptional regulator GlxA family with amidase domain